MLMVKVRNIDLISPKLRKVLTRDGIIVLHFVMAIVAVIDISISPLEETWFQISTYSLLLIFTLFGLLRLLWKDFLEKRPAVSVTFYTVILFVTVVFFSDYGQSYSYLFMVPVMLASLFFSRKMAYVILAIAALAHILQPVIQEFLYVDTFGPQLTLKNYGVVSATYLALFALSQIVIDATYVSESDRYTLEQAYNKLDSEQQKLQGLLSSMSDAVVGIDKIGRINVFNPAFLGLADIQVSPLGKDLAELIKLYTTKKEKLNLLEYVTNKRRRNNGDVFVLEYDENDRIFVNLLSQPVINRQNEVEGYVLVLRNITQQRRAEENRQTFLSLMAHEMRTPIANLEAQISNIAFFANKGSEYSGKLVNATNESHDVIVRLSKVVNELNLLIQSGSESPQLIRQEIRLQDFVGEFASQFKQLAHDKGLEFNFSIAENAPRTFISHTEYLGRIIDALLDNSVKFTKKGLIEFLVTRQEDDLIFVVKDTGVGIPKSTLNSLFEQDFIQAEHFEVRSSGGLGIGLYIASRMAHLLNGDLKITSAVNEGTKAILSIPILSVQSTE
ncbi:PAS domain-containing protein [Candidatus Saccharibacteria bacterium CPR2]|nr:PAS domain-containing protein [Candidatus Saccharibacteria bacterium CPR2]